LLRIAATLIDRAKIGHLDEVVVRITPEGVCEWRAVVVGEILASVLPPEKDENGDTNA
jgi:hypothetical protein